MNGAKPRPPRPRQRGQALSEFLAVALALVPLFLLIPMIAKYQDVAHMTHVATRYMAFDATTRNDVGGGWKPEHRLAAEVRRRFFANDDAPIKTADRAGNFDAHRNAFWRTTANGPLIRDIDGDVSPGFGLHGGARHTDAFSRASDHARFVLAEPMRLQARGIYTGRVSATLANLPDGIRSIEPFDRLDLVLVRSASILIDPWSSSGPLLTEERAGADPRLFPAGALRALTAFSDAAVAIIDLPGGFTGPKLGRLDFWRDTVPEDRLGARR